MSESKEVATIEKKKAGLIATFAERYNIDPGKVIDTLRKTAFPEAQTDAEFMALLVIANEHDLNPFLGEISAFSKNGRVYPMVRKDGWNKQFLRKPNYKGKTFRESEKRVTVGKSRPCPEWLECEVHFRDGREPEVSRVYMVEWYRDTPTWNTMPYQMLRGKAMKEACRESFGINLFDEDDRDRIIEVEQPPAHWPSASVADRARAALGVAPEPEIIEVTAQDAEEHFSQHPEDSPFGDGPEEPGAAESPVEEPPSTEASVDPLEPPTPPRATDGPETGLFAHDVDSPNRPVTTSELRKLAIALKQIPEQDWRERLSFYARGSRTDLTHGEYLSFLRWAKAWGAAE